MKKILFLLFLVLFLIGCTDKKVSVETMENIVVKKDKDLPYLVNNIYKQFTLNNGDLYSSEWLEVNLNNDEIDNLNLTLKNNILFNTKGFDVVDNNVVKGNLLSYVGFDSEKYISIVENSISYFDGIYGNKITKVYNIDKKQGIIIENIKLLNSYDVVEEDIYNKIRESNIIDADYVVMYVKNNGYNLYVDEDGRLILLFDYVSDDETIKKELVLND